MKEIILDWLKTKLNYVYYCVDTDDSATFQERLADLLVYGRVHFCDLKAADCYITQNIDSQIDYHLEHPNRFKYTFENFNIKRNEYIFDKVKMLEAVKNMTAQDTIQNRAIVLDLLKELKHRYSVTNKFIDHFDKYSYKEIFFDITKEGIDNFIQSIENSLVKSEFSFDEFKTNYIDMIPHYSRGMNEIGIFYPFKLDHDIFEKEHHLFEINHLKFNKHTDHIINLASNFYKKYGINSNPTKSIFTLHHFFAYPGQQYLKEFAYFDPFKNFEKYKQVYIQLKAYMKEKKLDFGSFIFELYEVFNEAQVGLVKFQHENLIDTLITTRSKNRQYSIRELINFKLKQLEKNELDIFGFDRQFYHAVLHFLQKQPADFIFSKSTKIHDMPGADFWPEIFKQNAQLILNDFLSVLNKDGTSNLRYIIDQYEFKLSTIIKKYQLKSEFKSILIEMLLDLAILYNKKDQKKLSKPFNTTFEKIYQKNQNKKIDDLINFDFHNEFIQEYRSRFEKYLPFEFKTEDGHIKYIMIM